MKTRLFLTLTALLLALSSYAAGTEINGIYYNLYSTAKTATVTYTGSNSSSGNNYLGDITIPATVTYGGTTYSVTRIGSEAFSYCTGLTSITIPNSVTSIEDYAFYECTGLTSITIPNSVTSIGYEAFFNCTSLTSVTINSNNIVSKAYSNDSNLRHIFGSQVTTYILGDNVTSIGERAFYYCTGLTSITIPSSVTSIGKLAFYDCTGLTSITIPESVTSIGQEAFRGCTGLTSITIPSSVTSIGRWAFSGCTSLTSITIGNSVTSIGDEAFYGCTGLTSIKVAAGNTKYDSRDNCNAIIETASNTLVVGCKATTIPNSVTSIRYWAFSGCTGLTSITIPNSVTTIGSAAFYGCTGLTSIKVEAGNTKYDSRDNCNAIIETASNTLVAGCKTTTIPSSVTSIGDYAFYWCRGLTGITIPSSVTSIGSFAFYNCSGLTSITIPSSVTSIGSSAFSDCTGLTSITIPSSVTSIGEWAFYGCTGLTSITIPSSVTSIGSSAFRGCTGLTSITISWDDPTNCTYVSDMLYGVPTSATLYVPAGTKALYENTEPWSSFENIEEKESVIKLNNTMGTYCDASGLDFSNVEGLEAYTATGYASGEVTLTRVNYVPANTGIVLRGTAGVYEVPKQKVSAYLTNLLKGTTSPITLNQTEGDMTNYILANGSKGIGFYKVASGGGTLAANKAYLQLPSNLSATRHMMLRFEDEYGQTTDIQYLYTSSDDETAPAIFDLQGRRVNGTMQQGGIYIVGGKKVIAK